MMKSRGTAGLSPRSTRLSISDWTVADGRLYLRSDKSATIALIDDLTPGGGMLRLPPRGGCAI